MASNSNYYEFRKAKVVIVRELFRRGWKVYGYKPDESDSMTDYYSPEYWDGIATLNGFTLVVDDSTAYYSGREIKEFVYTSEFVDSVKIRQTIQKLKEVRQDRGATAAEEETARQKITILEEKISVNDGKGKYQIIDRFPVYQGNPGKSSWHIEKDGIIIDKGNGIGKFADLYWFSKEDAQEELKNNDSESYRYKDAARKLDLYKKFIKFMDRIDSGAGKRLGGNKKAFTMETVEVTEFRNKNITVPCDGEIAVGQLFRMETDFNYGINKGFVYRITDVYDNYLSAVRLNDKLTKELTGTATRSNHFGCTAVKFNGWIEKGYIQFVRISSESIPVKVQKIVKHAV